MNSHAKTTQQEATEWLHRLHNMGYTVRHYNLRMAFPRDKLTEEFLPLIGPTWIIPPEKFDEFNSFIYSSKNEANLWLHKYHPLK